jgi:small subunit ribosomal protein S11
MTEEKTTTAVEKPKAQKKYTRSAKGKKRIFKTVPRGRAYIHASLNNTMITVTDQNGNAIAWASAGSSGFRGPKKATPYAASIVVNNIADKLEEYGVKELSIVVKGIGNGRDGAIRSLNSKGYSITSIKEVTPVPHNGCRPRRARRV